MKSNLQISDIENLSANAKQSWGPDRNYIFTKFINLPFSPFNRLEKLGACCDFYNIMATRIGNKPLGTNPPYQRPYGQQSGQTNFSRQNNNSVAASAQQQEQVVASQQPVMITAEEDNDFIQVSNTKDKKSKGTYLTAKNSEKERLIAQRKQREEQESEDLRLNKKPKKVKTAPFSRQKQVIIKTKFKEYTNVKVDWELLYESQKINIEQHPISDISFSTIKTTGKLKKYDKTYDKVDPRIPKKLDVNRQVILPSSSSLKDPILISLLQQDVEDQVKKPTVYTTDALLLALMTSKKGEFPWDILVEKEGNSIILDKYEEERMNYMDFQSVNENSNILPEDEKDLNKLCVEATTVTKIFQQQSTLEPTDEDDNLWDIAEGEENEVEATEQQNIAFKYVCVNIDDQIDIKVRVQLDAYETVRKTDPDTDELYDENVPVLIRSLNEFDHATQWKQKLATQKGSVTAGEYINNINNFMKWLIQMQISGAERLKLAYASRATPKDSINHNVLCVDSFSYDVLTNIIQFRSKDQWQVVKYFIDQIIGEKDGRYMFVKPAFKPSVKTYLLPSENVAEEGADGEEVDENDEAVNI